MKDYRILFPIMTNKSAMLLSLLVLHSMYTHGKTICKWQLVKEWHTQPSSYVVNWTLSENICVDVYGDCWFEDINTKMSTSGNKSLPQICPLQIQFGDILVISSEPSLQYPEINLMNVSEASFIDCLQNTTTEEQFLFGCKLKGMRIVNSKWLGVGTHYFITVMASGTSLCQLGLRLNVTVKEQSCQEYLSSEYCSGHGKCLTEIWSKTYICHCEPPFSGKYCQELDSCSYKPCKNNGSCINKSEKTNKPGYECTCHPPSTGINCSKIIDQYQPHACFHENWSNVTEKSFVCECDEPYSGSFCEDSVECCFSPSGWEREICQNESSACTCVSPEGRLSQNRESGVSKCLWKPCRIGADRTDISNDTMCICSPKCANKLCKELQTPWDPFLCKNNATYVNYEKDYHCSCVPRFTGKNCEKVIDHCRLLSVNCLSEEWCFNIIGRFRDVCTRNLCWFLKNICLIYLSPCNCGSISHDICQAEVPHSLHLKCVWQLRFTVFEGEKFEVTIDAHSFHAENCTDDAVYVNKSEDLGYLCLFQCEEPMEMCANGCSCLTEEDSKEYFCLCIHRRPRKMNQKNTTDYQESGCQPEAVHDEFNMSRCSCSLSYIDRFCVLNTGDCFGNQSTLSHGLCGVHLHSCNCSCLRIYKRKICEIETEDRKSMPCKTGVTGIILSGYFFGTCVPGFRGLLYEINEKKFDSSSSFHNTISAELMDDFKCMCPPGFIDTKCDIDADKRVSRPCKNGATCTGHSGNYCGQSEALFKVVAGFPCLCHLGSAHLRWEPDTDGCIPNACEHSPPCKDLLPSYQCMCLSGEEGNFCEQESNDCKMNPCENNSTCTDLHNSYRCECTSGWTGKNCSEEINECDSDPCMNGALCHESTIPGQFVCLCPPFYTGKFCHQHYNPSDSLTDPCRNNATCLTLVDGNHSCICREGFKGKHYEITVNVCFSLSCQSYGDYEGGAINCRYVCRYGFSGLLCEIETECSTNPCKNKATSVNLTHRFFCDCEHGYHEFLCELNMDECEISPCPDGENCINRTGACNCLCVPGYTGINCEVDIDECVSKPCLHDEACIDLVNHYIRDRKNGTLCETNANDCLSNPFLCGSYTDLINEYHCSCDTEWTSSRCEIKINACCTGFLCGDERRVSCFPSSSQRTDAISTQTDVLPSSVGNTVSSFPSPKTTELWTIMKTPSVDQGSKETDIFKHDIFSTADLSVLSIGISFENYLLEVPISTRQLSAKYSLSSSTDASSSQFLNFDIHDLTQIVRGTTSVPCVPTQTSAVTPGFLDRKERTSIIICSLLTDFIFPTQPLLFDNDQTVALSATTMRSVIKGIPEADIQLNRHSFLSPGFFLTTASTSVPPVVSRGAQEDTEEHSAVPLISRRDYWRLLSSSMSPISPAKIIISKQVAFLNSSTLHRFTAQASNPSEYQIITEASSNRRLTNTKSQTAASLSELSQTCATCSMTEIKSSHKFSDQVLHSKQSHFYETFGMNSEILASWYALMGTQTITSGHSLSSATEITPPVAFTELSSLFLSEKRTKGIILSSSLEEAITLSSNLDVDLCLDNTGLCIVPSQTDFFDLMHSDFTSKLTTDDPLLSRNIFKILKIGKHGITMGPTEVLNQDNLLGMKKSKESQQQFKLLTSDSSLNFELNLQSHPATVHSNDLKNNPPPYVALMSDILGATSNVALYTISPTRSLPMQDSFPTSVFMPDGTHFTDYVTLTSDLKEEARTSSEWSQWDLQPSVHDWESAAVVQRLPSTRSLTSSLLESIPIPRPLMVSGLCSPCEFVSYLIYDASGTAGWYTHQVCPGYSNNYEPKKFCICPPNFSCVCYYGDSYLQFQNIFLNPQNNISLEFQTFDSCGLLLYIQQDSNLVDGYFIQLFIENGTLQYYFSCAGEAKLRHISTTVKVDDGQKYSLLIRQELDPCQAELTLLGKTIKASEPTNHVSRKPLPESGSIFIGGFPDLRANQIAGPVENFTGCIEVIEVNNWGSFIPSKAAKQIHVDNCRSQDSALPAAASFVAPSGGTEGVGPMWTSHSPAPAEPSVCQGDVCHNGGTCHPVFLSGGVFSFQCDCPLHFTGRFCEQDAGLVFPSFNENSYIELPFFTTLNGLKFLLEKEQNRIVTIYLTVKTRALNGTILYSGEKNFGQQFLHLFLVEGRPIVKYGCGSSQNSLTLSADYTINTNAFVPITIRHYYDCIHPKKPLVFGEIANIILSALYKQSFTMPSGSPGVACMIKMTADGKPPIQKSDLKISQASQAHFESMFLGHVPENIKTHKKTGPIYGFKGCIGELQVNHKEYFIAEEALHGKNIENCHVPWCARHQCHNNGTCISDGENWFCECPRPYSGKLCQFAACENDPCRNGATCVPKSGPDFVCLCPYGRSGLLCTDAINITQPRFSGMDAFGHTSFLAYSRIPDISFDYEFHLNFQLANNHSALQNNLILFTGQKGHGLDGDDFLAVGLRDGSVVYSYNLGSGVASISSDPLDLSLGIHTVHLGRFFQRGWLKVDDHKNKSIISPGKLVGLNVFSQFYVGGYSEYTPDLLPHGADFKNGFQGCIFSIQVRTRKDGHFRRLGNPEGHPDAGRSVGQCDASPCSLMNCGNGGTCRDRGSTVYCDCPIGWKGAFCTETVSTCDPEHDPPHQCSKGATCVSLPHGYTCFCPLGTTGVYCEQALSISDPSFRSHELSWMSFASFRIRKKTHIQLQFQPFSTDGILFYVAQQLQAQSGDFLCISLVNGSVQLRYNLGDRTIILETLQKVNINGSTWHVIKAGRVGAEGYLDLDGINVTEKANVKMSYLDTSTDFYIGGVSSLSLVNPMATANDAVGFQGCVREVIINNQELQLTELGAKGGSNVGDCDGTACGYNACQNEGECVANGTTFLCRCLPHWTGRTCDLPVHCVSHLCLHQSLCTPAQSFSYGCLCALGWAGRYCENKTSFSTAKFMGNSYIKYIDPHYRIRNLQFTIVSLNFSTTEREGLIIWIGKAQNEENDFLAIGLHNRSLKIAVNLGENISVPMIYSHGTFCCNSWHRITIIHNQTLIKAYLDGNLILSEDIDPQKKFVSLNYDGIIYLGGFEYGREVNIVTQEMFKRNFVGKIKDVFFQDSKKIELIESEGYNVYTGDGEN